MNRFHAYLLAAAAATLAACSTVPADNTALTRARGDFQQAQANAQTQSLAVAEFREASDALAAAEAASRRKDDASRVTQLAYLASQRIALANEVANRKAAETQVASASAERDRIRLAARTREADQATQAAASATQQAQDAQRAAASSQQQARTAQQQAQAAQQQAQTAEQRADASATRNAMLEQQMREMNARQTDRGMVITLGDVLFDTGRAELRNGAVQNLERLAAFQKANPQRRAAIEGYTDSTGGDAMNLALSARRAEAVTRALVQMGVNRAQLQPQGYGEAHPVSDNDTASGRQANRRVEVLLSDEQGQIKPR